MNTKTARFVVPMTVTLWRRSTEAERAAHGAAYSIEDGTATGEVEVEVDLAGLARSLGQRAMRSAGGRAIEAGGLVTVRARNVKRTRKGE